MQPGDTISPSSDTVEEQKETKPKSKSSEDEQMFYKPEAREAVATVAPTDTRRNVSWSASEYVDHEKSGSWYALLGIIAALVIAGMYLLTSGDLVTVIVAAVAVVLFGIVAARRPRTLQYEINSHGIVVGEKQYPFTDFKTFSLITETTIHSVQLQPLKRFMPPLSIYFPPDMEDAITESLGMYLPYEERGHDAFDRLMSRIRF